MERRTFLVLGAAALGLAGCTGEDSAPSPSGSVTSAPPADPDDLVRGGVADSELALIAEYRAAIAAHPEFEDDLAPFLAHHEAHLARVAPQRAAGAVASGSASAADSRGAAATPSTPGSPTPSGSPAPSASGSPAPTDASPVTSEPASSADALAALADAEAQARRQRIRACDAAADPELARVLAVIAASEAQHAVVLDDLAGAAS